jgi:putative transposase
MTRLPRSRLGEGVYHVLNRGINRSRIFGDYEDKLAFLELLKEYRAQKPIRILHWIIMDNHFHLVLEVGKIAELTAFMAGLQRSYTAHHHRRRRKRGENACGYLWQGRFKSPLIERESNLLCCGRYVERNAVRARIEKLPWDYRWSSARAYALGFKDKLTDIRFNQLYLTMGDTQEERQEAWKTFLMEQDAHKDESFFMGGKKPVGSLGFLERILSKDGRPTDSHRGKARDTDVTDR